MAVTVGVLALQGGFQAHERVLRALGADVREVRVPRDLHGLDGLVIPGGESTTMTLGVARERLAAPLRELAARGVPVLGTCAGLIMLDRDHLGLMDIRADRNAFGRQIKSFEADVSLRGLAAAELGDTDPAELGDTGGARQAPLRAVFIRAPWVAEHGPDVEVLAELDGHPIAVRQGALIAVAFHPELSGDDRVHRLLLAEIARARARAGAPVA
jgi:pyridoxal 5'-phosphate synthase pdxT subunit